MRDDGGAAWMMPEEKRMGLGEIEGSRMVVPGS